MSENGPSERFPPLHVPPACWAQRSDLALMSGNSLDTAQMPNSLRIPCDNALFTLKLMLICVQLFGQRAWAV